MYQQELSLELHFLTFEWAYPINQQVNIVATLFDFQVFSNRALLFTWYSLINSNEPRPKKAKQLILKAGK